MRESRVSASSEVQLNEQQTAATRGDRGPVLAKLMQVLVLYADAMGAKRMLEIEAGGHFSPSDPTPAIGMRLEMLEKLVAAGLRTTHPFTLDPRWPENAVGLTLTHEERELFAAGSRDGRRYHELMVALGLRDEHAYTCTPYEPEVGNRPARDAVISWSESSCVIYANSVLGARCNRTPAILDLFSNIAGCTPEFGLLTADGRMATWRVDLDFRVPPDPQLLGAAIAQEVVGDVPYIVGLDALLGRGMTTMTDDYLKEMGTACAAVGGAVGLMHVEGITPEAEAYGRGLLRPDCRLLTIDGDAIARLIASYRMTRPDTRVAERCVIGCPQLSYAELQWWVDAIETRVEANGRVHVAVQTILSAAPQVIARYAEAQGSAEHLRQLGIELTPACFEAFMDNPACARRPTVTTSNKLRAYTSARLLGIDEILAVIAGDEEGRRG